MVSIEEFKDACISFYTAEGIAKHYGCSASTIRNKVREAFPDLPLQTRTPIGYKLLHLEGKMKCYVCGEVHPHSNYHANKYSKNGLAKECKSCMSVKNTSDKKRKVNKEYRSTKEGKAIRAALEAKRRAAKIQRTMAWANLDAIKEMYVNCPEGHEVDHIIPLQGKLVSGLHVEANLQYLPAEENRKKANSFIT